jgi:hypothetical protein
LRRSSAASVRFEISGWRDDTLYPLALVAGNLFGGAMLLDRHRPPISF